MLIYILIIFSILVIYKYNINSTVNSDTKAKINQYSDNNNYKYITPLKHDIFKQWTVDLMPFIIAALIPLNHKNFFESIIGRFILSGFGYVVYYQISQPYIVNRLPSF